jgi:hypothetical protein
MLASALRAAGRGWRCFPVQARGKRPLVKWQEQATTDEAQLRRWWSGRWQCANVGAVVPDQTVVLDVDPRHGGDETLARLEANYGVLPATLTCLTGSGGQHLWFAVDDPDQLRQDAGVLGPGVDSRCSARGYLVIPPSVHPCGGGYVWAHGPRVRAPAPPWLMERLRKSAETRPLVPAAQPVDGDRYGQRALHEEASRLASATVGQRNQRLYMAAIRMGQLVGAGVLDQAEVVATLTATGIDVGLLADEVKATLDSGLAFGMVHPR